VTAEKALLLAALVMLSFWSVYTSYITIHYFDLATNMTFRELSQLWYDRTLAGTQPFPYQWRMLAFVVVAALESATHLDPHLIDLAVKTLALSASAAVMFWFARAMVSPLAAALTAVTYLLVTAGAFASEGYGIYFSNDYLAVLSWFAGVVAVRRRAWAIAAAAAFIGGWAKETTVLIVILVTIEAVRGRAPWRAVALCALAFAIPSGVLRTMYPAPIQEWAWWDTFRLNVPFLVWEPSVIARALRDNLKVLLFLHVAWWWAYRAWRRTRDPFMVSLAATLACYAVMAWTVVYIRELRHMLPFTILILPLAAAEAEALLQDKRKTTT
jgi:hypothetical protein